MSRTDGRTKKGAHAKVRRRKEVWGESNGPVRDAGLAEAEFTPKELRSADQGCPPWTDYPGNETKNAPTLQGLHSPIAGAAEPLQGSGLSIYRIPRVACSAVKPGLRCITPPA